MAIYWLAAPLSAFISFVAGGWLNELYGWRLTFFFMGIPGVLVAILVKMTIRDPRQGVANGRHDRSALPGFWHVLKCLWNQRSSRHLAIGVILYYMLGLGLGPWYAAFMIRSHDMQTSELGLWLGVIWSVSGAAGLLIGAQLGGRLWANNERAQMRLCAGMVAMLVPCYALFLLLPQKTGALLALVPLAVVSSVFFGPTFALMQSLVHDKMRATTLSVVMLLANLIGMGVGPQIVGLMSDRFQASFGQDSLRYAMLAASFVALWAAYHFLLVSRSVAGDLRRLRATM